MSPRSHVPLPSLVLNGLLFIGGLSISRVMNYLPDNDFIIVNDRCPKDKLSQVLIVESPKPPCGRSQSVTLRYVA